MKTAEEIIGAVGFSVMTVRPGDTCLAMGISDLPILAPGHLMSVMESACVAALVELLENGETTVVDKFDISLIDSVGIGTEIRANARCTEVVTQVSMTEISIEIDEFGNVEHREIQIEQTHVERYEDS